jgi:hypothetical protein
MPRALVPYQKSLTRSINARGVHPGSINVSGDLAYDESLFDVADDLTDDRFRLKCAFDDLVQWRTRKSLPEFDKTQTSLVYQVFKGLLAIYHATLPVAWADACSARKIERARQVYKTYCEDAVPLGQLGQAREISQANAMDLLALAIHEQQQIEEEHFRLHAQRYLDELAALLPR